MENDKNIEGNPEVVENAIFGSPKEEDCFEQLDKSVNGLVHDGPKTGTLDSAPQQQAQPQQQEQVTPNPGDVWESDDNPYKKRYKDSSREAIEQRTINKDNEKYSALINVMKKDPNVVGVVRDYLENGGTPSSVKDQMNLSEDFVFDPDEAMSNPDSDSARVFNGMVAKVSNEVVDKKMSALNAQQAEQQQQQRLAREAEEFRTRKGISEEQFNGMIEKANSRQLTYDDLWLLTNREVANKNISDNAQKEVLNQMKKAQSIPQTLSGQGSVSQDQTVTHEGRVFDQLKSLDLDLDNLFD